MKTGIIQDSNIKKVLITLTSNSNGIEFASIIITDYTNFARTVIYSRNFIVQPLDIVFTEIPLNASDYNDSPSITAFEIEYITSTDLLGVNIDYAY